ncbi:MAG: hypothetical protein NTW86_18490 [Candidatus Sumerlaeota bacterium]|nr:hypothetical protein [Candidatus Sumerlaeota bacterium]
MALPCVMYGPALRIPFLAHDYVEWDVATVPAHEFLLKSAYLEKGSGVYYRPGWRAFDHFTQWLAGHRENPKLEHVVSLGIHALGVALLFALVWQQCGFRLPGAIVGALFLALHPTFTAVPIWYGCRWAGTSVVLLLLVANLYEWVFASQRSGPPVALLLGGAVLTFCLALNAEIGALCMGIVGLWTMVLCWRKRDLRWAVACLAPLAAALFAYLIMRRIALGQLFAPYVTFLGSAAERLALYGKSLLHELAGVLNPIHLPLIGSVNQVSPALAVAMAALGIGAVAAALLWKPTREFLFSNPLPALGLAAYGAFQLNAMWLFDFPPAAIVGFERGYTFYLPVALLALLLGQGVDRLWSRWRFRGRAILTAVAMMWLLLAGRMVVQSMQLWSKAGQILTTCQTMLTPVLQKLPEKSQVFMRGFPGKLKEPYQQWAFVFDACNHAIAGRWAHKKLGRVFNEFDGCPPCGFEGCLLEYQADRILCTRVDPQSLTQEYLRRQQADGPAPPWRLRLTPGPDGPGAPRLSFVRMQVEDLGNETYRLEFTGNDTFVYVTNVRLGALDYGTLAYDIRVAQHANLPWPISTTVYFGNSADPLDEYKTVRQKLPDDGEWHEVRWPLYKTIQWVRCGEVTILRFNFLDRTGIAEVRNIRLENSAPGTDASSDR